MTKKDYELIAEVLREYIYMEEKCDDSSWAKEIALDLADIFASENERFNYSKFMGACTA
tara:strand:- start:150 stop:326 length:177 start_codon:yes stop_codon:yes gene_type:complete